MDPRGVRVRGRWRGRRLLALLCLCPLLAACSGPTEPESRGPWLSVRAGTCGLTTEGDAFCWGVDTQGELGQGPGESGTMFNPRFVLTPSPVIGGLRFEQIRPGGAHTCALTPEGEAFCWGNNRSGELGDGQQELPGSDRLTPTPVTGGRTFRRIDVGGAHTCALTPEGEAFCWGDNAFGQLGDGTTDDRSTPAPVETDLTFEQIGAGAVHTCALTPEGRAFCWGGNELGQLGNGTTTDRFTPTPLPTPVEAELTFREIDVGNAHTCALTTAGRAFCWGNNGSGTLGDGTTTHRSSPTPVETGLTFEQISAGGAHTCGLTDAGQAFCWGDNGFGAIGDGTTTDRLAPTAVSGGLVFRQISTSGDTCGVTVDDEAFCWGRGPVGDGTLTDRLVPTRIAPPEE